MDEAEINETGRWRANDTRIGCVGKKDPATKIDWRWAVTLQVKGQGGGRLEMQTQGTKRERKTKAWGKTCGGLTTLFDAWCIAGVLLYACIHGTGCLPGERDPGQFGFWPIAGASQAWRSATFWFLRPITTTTRTHSWPIWEKPCLAVVALNFRKVTLACIAHLNLGKQSTPWELPDREQTEGSETEKKGLQGSLLIEALASGARGKLARCAVYYLFLLPAAIQKKRNKDPYVFTFLLGKQRDLCIQCSALGLMFKHSGG